ncbi:response regulator [Dyella japonica]|uniref:histidine kinase n=1 Tax=Dyella japonica DSM 16301 TaxID=1440762 RepID=A0A0G9GZ82_9GAMM|nr:response regulator [Dyella japonica]KLD62561.1 histidine kinase [Dyella japonica DSM 16301]
MAAPKNRYSWLAHQPMQQKILVAIGTLVLLFVICSVVSLQSLSRQDISTHWSRHTYDVRAKIDDVTEHLQASQMALRGFLLNPQGAELTAHQQADAALARDLSELRTLTTDNPLQQGRIDRIESMADQWQKDALQHGIEPMQAVRGSDATEAALERVRVQTSYLAHRTVFVADILGVLKQMDDTEAALLDQREATQQRDVREVRAVTWITMLLSLLLGGSVVYMTFRLITRPIRRMTDLMTRLAGHDHSVEIRQLERRDEIGEIARALQVFKQMAIETAAQTWVKTQVSQIASDLQKVETEREFAEQLTGTLGPLLECGVGVFYRFDEQDQRLRLQGSYGYQQRRHLSTEYALGEGLVGQSALERKPITLQDVPEDYVRIHSGSGEASPNTITVLPLILRDKLLGVLELASFHHFTEPQQRLLNELLPIASLSLENLGRAIRTQDLLMRTSEQADELRASEETLRRQQQDLQVTNEELNAKTHELQEQSQRLLASEEELRVQTEELQASNEELRQKTDTLNQQKHVLENLQRETQEKAEELARASQYKSEFLANMSHELRTPLNSLLILSRSLADNREGNLDSEQVESARIIHDSGSNLLRLINDILDLSKVEAGKMDVVLDDFPLADLERALKRTFNHVAQDKQIDFIVKIDPGLPATLRTDATKLEQIANNLIGNAFKFTHQGSVTAHIGRPSAAISLPAGMQGKDVIAIAVTDTGIGIPPDKAQKIFQAFEQVDASTSRQYGGTGLGLTISKRIAELLDGDIVLHSEVGHGSTFTILLPLEGPTGVPMAPAANGITTPAPARPTMTQALLPETIEDDRASMMPGDTVILIIEDDPVFARILADMVRRKGYRVLAAADGESGLQLAAKHSPTGILLDVMLPGMDGWTVIERLKENAATRHVPVHFISAVDEANRGRDLGAVGFLTKPVSREAIGEAFDRLLHFAEGRMRHLLIVDDDADSRAAMRTLLRNDDVSIEEAGSAEEALERMHGTTYDCIVLDLGLPGISGIELLEQLAAAGSIPPVVVYSGRELSREESLKLRQYTDSIVIKGARSPERLLDEVSLFLHSIQGGRVRQAAVGAKTTAAPPAPALTDAHELVHRKVLLVDDDMRNLFALSKVLRGWGMHVTMAQDGLKALKALSDHSDIELVLMDVMMPVMDGYDTIREIRAQPQLAKLPIIALTAKAMRGDREKCLEAGANDYLSKPIDIDKLSSMMHVWLHR